MATSNTTTTCDTRGSKLGLTMTHGAVLCTLVPSIWKFPYTAGEMAVVHSFWCLFFVIFIGFSVMLTEFAIGVIRQKSAVGAFKSTDRGWTFAGVIGVVSGLLIMGFCSRWLVYRIHR